MSWLADQLTKPEYLFRPRQLLLRWRRGRLPFEPTVTVSLPWGLPLTVCPSETIGRQIWLMGVFDIVVTETLWRLLDAGELAVDAGANIGYMSSVLAARTGAGGKVLAFEPHPVLYQRLVENNRRWVGANRSVATFNQALADFTGTATLFTPLRLGDNSGQSTLVAEAGQTGAQLAVPVIRLDEVLAGSDPVGLVKLDVEGAELRVLEGARWLLESRRIRDIVFEDNELCHSAVTRFMEDFGYEVFSLRLRLWGPVVRPLGEPTVAARSWDSPSRLATLDPQRVLARMRRPGWQCLRDVR